MPINVSVPQSTIVKTDINISKESGVSGNKLSADIDLVNVEQVLNTKENAPTIILPKTPILDK